MVKFKCRDMGMDCDYFANAGDLEEAMDMAITHTVETHTEILMDLTPTKTRELSAKLESLIREYDREEIKAKKIAEA
jgi:predicted small metal-binding protein